jgi:AcrR family transcriptional regulator
MGVTTLTYAPEKTRQDLLESAFDEIWQNGFRAASLDAILGRVGVTKGALYHHFRNKLELGYAAVDEVLRDQMRAKWFTPMEDDDDPIAVMLAIRDRVSDAEIEHYCQFGCPLNNLAQEMSPIDEGFRRRLDALYREWRHAISDGLRRGQKNGFVRENIDPDHAAIFYIAVLEGAIGIAKNAQDPDLLEPCLEGLKHYLDALRPRRSFRNE